VVFNRYYEPIWQRSPEGETTRADPDEWVPYIRQEYLFNDGNPPWCNSLSLAACLDALHSFGATWEPIANYADVRRMAAKLYGPPVEVFPVDRWNAALLALLAEVFDKRPFDASSVAGSAAFDSLHLFAALGIPKTREADCGKPDMGATSSTATSRGGATCGGAANGYVL
jgi:hypothetical protein